MPTKKTHKAAPPAPDSSEAVDAFMAKLDHPLKAQIEAVRKIVRGAAPGIEEGVKWNSASFRTTEYFATIHLRSTKEVQIILHLGAKVRKSAKTIALDDPRGLARMLAKDRALVTVRDAAAEGAALKDLVRQWVAFV